MKNVLKLLLSAVILFAAVPTLNAPDVELYQSCLTASDAVGSLDSFWTVYP